MTWDYFLGSRQNITLFIWNFFIISIAPNRVTSSVWVSAVVLNQIPTRILSMSYQLRRITQVGVFTNIIKRVPISTDFARFGHVLKTSIFTAFFTVLQLNILSVIINGFEVLCKRIFSCYFTLLQHFDIVLC